MTNSLRQGDEDESKFLDKLSSVIRSWEQCLILHDKNIKESRSRYPDPKGGKAAW